MDEAHKELEGKVEDLQRRGGSNGNSVGRPSVSKTVDELIMVFEKARAEAAPFPQHHEDGLYAGIAAVVRAVRDAIVEDGNCKYCVATTAMYNEILGDAEEKVAGNQWTASTQPPMRNNADAAPAVCVWTPYTDENLGANWWRSCGGVRHRYSFDGHHPCASCGKFIKFTEAK